ncbi:MAG: hypothetical protein IT383_03655 [Deltaproteobacteria bacterium]|nr:hypothetical protein [Deltaproteobacteria bacterium]
MVDLCKLARTRSEATWDTLRRARYAHLRIGEETLTELNLVELVLGGGGQIRIFPFTKRAEAHTGADWEWWVRGLSGAWVGMRVQAKALDPGTDAYDHLWYARAGVLQIDRLIKAALAGPVPRFPLYMLYNNWDPATRKVPWSCGGRRYWGARAMGCAVAAATALRPLQKRKDGNRAVHVLELSTPFHCLFCAPTSPGTDLAEAVSNRLRGLARHVLLKPPAILFHTLDGPPIEEWIEAAAGISTTLAPPWYVLNPPAGDMADTPDDLAGVVVLAEQDTVLTG